MAAQLPCCSDVPRGHPEVVGKRVGEATGPVIEVWGDQEGWAMPFTFTADLHGPHQLPHAHYFLRFLQVQAAPEVRATCQGKGGGGLYSIIVAELWK